MCPKNWRARAHVAILAAGFLFGPREASSLGEDDGCSTYRWQGADFVFCLITDDGSVCNLPWAQVAREMDFRFTIADNPGKIADRFLSFETLHDLHEEGFEIANHSYSHGFAGLPLTCPKPPLGSLLGYWNCGADPDSAMIYFAAEIERDTLCTLADLPLQDVCTFAYPRHMHAKTIIDSLMIEGYIAARFGDSPSFSYFSDGDFTTPPRNGWEEGISLFRVPVAGYTNDFFGNHSAVPPQHFSYSEFLAATMPIIDEARAKGGIFALFTHHLGDDDDSMGDINYGSGGMTCEDLHWIVDLVRTHGGTVMTFGEAASYFRSRARMVELDGDLVWMTSTSSIVPSLQSASISLQAAPNPFNGAMEFGFDLPHPELVSVEIFDVSGHLVFETKPTVMIAGRHGVPWSGCDLRGRPLPSGVYFANLSAGNLFGQLAVTLLK